MVGLSLLILLTGCGIGKVHPAPRPVTNAHERSVLVVGDSLVASAQELIESEMREAGMRGPVHHRGVGGSGLLSTFPMGRTGGQLLSGFLAETDPDIVIIGDSGNHPPVGNILDNGYARGSDRWHQDWNAELTRMVKEAQSYGASVYVVKMPPMVEWSDPSHEDYPSARRNRVTDDSTIVAEMLGAGVLDWWEAIQPASCEIWVLLGREASESCYSTELEYSEDGTTRTVRMPDGLHLTPWGAARAARWTVATIRSEWD